MTEQTYKVRLEQFEGPLDLLLHLIHKLEIDIYDIPMTEVTNQYFEYIQAMKFLELDIASEYLVMAATLIEIKSNVLLPKPVDVDVEEVIEEDPREQLLQKLLEYRKFKQAATHLKERETDETRVYIRPVDRILKENNGEIKAYEPVPFFELIDAFKNVLQRKSWREPIERTIKTRGVSVEERMEQILNLINTHKIIHFNALFQENSKTQIVSTFLAILQLLKDNLIKCEQEVQFGDFVILEVGVKK